MTPLCWFQIWKMLWNRKRMSWFWRSRTFFRFLMAKMANKPCRGSYLILILEIWVYRLSKYTWKISKMNFKFWLSSWGVWRRKWRNSWKPKLIKILKMVVFWPQDGKNCLKYVSNYYQQIHFSTPVLWKNCKICPWKISIWCAGLP